MNTLSGLLFSPVLSVSLIFFSSLGWTATSVLPACLDRGNDLPINNDQIAEWKSSTQNQFLARGHVSGAISRIFPDHSNHNHFEIQMDTPTGDTLEIVFSKCDGTLPALRTGMRVEACGDYITSMSHSGSNPVSPDGAILHWVHKSLPVDLCGHNYGDGGDHDSGYLAIDGQVYGGY